MIQTQRRQDPNSDITSVRTLPQSSFFASRRKPTADRGATAVKTHLVLSNALKPAVLKRLRKARRAHTDEWSFLVARPWSLAVPPCASEVFHTA